MTQNILVLNDLHVGSIFGLMPNKVVIKNTLNGEDEVRTPNPTQKALLKCWNEMLKNLPKIDKVILNGDLCDGPQRKSLGKFTWTNDLGVQVEACKLLLKTLPCQKFYGTLGSEYHTQEDRPLDRSVVEGLGGTFRDEIFLDVEEARIQASHYVPVSMSAWQYRLTPLARDLMLYALNQDEYGKVDWILRGHAHYYALGGFGSMGGCIVPGWQTRTPYAIKKGIVSPPQVGYVILMVDGDTVNHYLKRWRIANQVPVVQW